MAKSRTAELFSKSLMYLLALASLLLPVWLVVAMLSFRTSEQGVPPGNRLYLASGAAVLEPKSLFQLEWEQGGGALRAAPGLVTPTNDSGNAIVLQPGQSSPILVGRYWYDFRLVAERNAAGGVARSLKWELTGARYEVDEEVGRAPAFFALGRFAYDSPRAGGQLSAWLDGMPTRAFRVRSQQDCQGGGVCLELTTGKDLVTIERTDQIHHPQRGELIAMGPRDRVWVGHLNYIVTQATDAKNMVDIRLSQDFQRYRGDRRGLGPAGLHGELADLDVSRPVQIEDVTSQFRTGHLSDRRWNPQTEDEYQLLIDQGLLCVETMFDGQRMVPQIVWRDPTKPGCQDPVDQKWTGTEPVFASGVLDVYRRRRGTDGLVPRANQLLKTSTSPMPEDLPFVFEWWPVSTDRGVVKLPIALWGVRTMATLRQLDPEPATSAVEMPPADRPIVLRSRRGDQSILAQTIGGRRVYAAGEDLLGLGPLLGLRGAVDGLDQVVPSVPVGSAAREVQLTIDPGLQAALWTEMKRQAGRFSSDSGPRRLHGFSAVGLDGVTGDVLAVLNWPEALKWEDAAEFADLGRRTDWGVPGNSLNTAMLRADKVGSVFKLLAMYTMADAGVLDTKPAGGTSHWCDRSAIRVVETGPNGRVVGLSGSPFRDNQYGPLPVPRTGLNGGLDRAVAASCNSFFAFASFMLLDESAPDATWMDDCPVDASLRRTDLGKVSSRQWVVCTRRGSRGRQSDSENWLLLPPSERLSERSLLGFKGGNTRPLGYFARALDAGYRFEAQGQAEVASGGDSYQGAAYFGGWMPDLPNAQGRIFNYPMMLSPRSHFGAIAPDGTQIPGVNDGWRAFSAQAIGEAGRGSALSVAVLYAGVARGNGEIPAPRLLVTNQLPNVRGMFAFQPQRQERLEAALKAPLGPGGTARSTVGRLKFRDDLLGKTGTFEIEHDASRSVEPGSPSAAMLEACGALALENGGLISSPSPSLLGAGICESTGLLVTGVHHYPEGRLPVAPPGTSSTAPRPVGEAFTSFAAVIRPPAGSSTHPVVFVLIADIDEYKNRGARAASFVEPLLTVIWQWMRTPTS